MIVASARSIVEWLDLVLASKSPRTREGYAHVVNRLFAYLEQQQIRVTLDALRPMHLRAFLAHARQAGATPNTVANFDRTLRAIFLRIEREGIEDLDLPTSWKSPLTAVEKTRPVVVRKTPLTADQAKRLLDTAKGRGFIAARDHAQSAFMLMTGAFTYNQEFWQSTSCARASTAFWIIAAQTYKSDEAESCCCYPLSVKNHALAFSLLQIATLSFAYSASLQPKQRRFMGIRKGLFS